MNQYYVIGPDGSKYGPVDIATLQTWKAEGRVLPTTQIEDAQGQRFSATVIPGLFDGPSGPPPNMAPPNMGAPSYGGYSRSTMAVDPMDDGTKELKRSRTYAIVSLFCCPILTGIAAIVYANKAIEKGNPRGAEYRTQAYIMMGIGIAIGVVIRLATRDFR